jgi:hypothetical protein
MFSYFRDRVSHFCPGSLDRDISIYASHTAGMTGVHHHTQLLVEMRV